MKVSEFFPELYVKNNYFEHKLYRDTLKYLNNLHKDRNMKLYDIIKHK